MKELGYHGTCSKHRYSIENDGLDPSKSQYRSDHWLGQGVYFFDDYEKARWWASNSSSRNGNCGGLVFQSLIEANDEKVLDLDDNSQFDCFLTETINTLDEIQKECLGKMPIFKEDDFRALFFDYYKQKHEISVIMGTFQKDVAGYTTKRSPEELEKQRKIMKIIHFKFHERQICVSKKECIKSTKIVYNEEEEVI
ncbi:MAG: hypothetical protein NC318_06090 [Blautia sp.]|nr:hypothetical protein [Lachnoclostridium sp.]MCM1211155.1 hypothetical protein [Blautia sp.]